MAARPYFAAFIDAGFLKAEGRKSLGLPRDAPIDTAAVVSWLRQLGDCDPADPECLVALNNHVLLRAYWYDGAYEAGTQEHTRQRPYREAVEATPGIHARWGHLLRRPARARNAILAAVEAAGADRESFLASFEFRDRWEQKGVDTRIVLDLVRLAGSGAYDVAVLITGDRDIAEGVREAQAAGRRVLLVHPSRAGVARELRDTADDRVIISDRNLARMFGVPVP